MSTQKEKITLPTGFGEAAAIQLASEMWWLKTPWAREMFTGDKNGAFRRLRELVWEAEATPEHNTVYNAVKDSIDILTNAFRSPRGTATDQPEPHTATVVLHVPAQVV